MDFKRVYEPSSCCIVDHTPSGCYEAYQILKRELDKGTNAKILVYGDPDIDGIMSQEIMQLYLQQLGFSSQYYLNDNRAHGFKLDLKKLEKIKGGLIIAVDFSIPYEDFVTILRMGISIINIDHHEINISKYTKNTDKEVYLKCGDAYGIIMNNQYHFENPKFKFLSGAGMVYYFVKYISRIVEVPLYADYGAMAGISLLSDIRELENSKAGSFLEYTYNHQSTYMDYLTWLVTDESRRIQGFASFGKSKMSREFIDFTFSPVFNSLLRANQGTACVELLKGVQSTFEEMTRSNRILMYRDMQKKVISAIGTYYKEAKDQPGSGTKVFDNMIVCPVPENLELGFECNISNYIGVACSQIKDEYKTGVIFVIDPETKRTIRGSVRGGMDGVDYLTIFNNNGLTCAGHHNAFGILECDFDSIDFEKISEDIRMAEEEVKQSGSNTRKVIPVNNLYMLMKSAQVKTLARINEYVRDNHRVFVKYVGNSEIKTLKKTDKFASYSVDGVEVKCFDPSLSIKDDFLLITLENGEYATCTLRKAFEYEKLLSTQEFAEFYAKLKEE